jgi:hypothetical protein
LVEFTPGESDDVVPQQFLLVAIGEIHAGAPSVRARMSVYARFLRLW